MRFLPIVGRELRVAARRRSTFTVRFWAVLIALVVTAWQLLVFAQSTTAAAAQGEQLFATLSILMFAYCVLAGARATADCLSEEKREGTLGLLFLTDLKAYDVVLGKLAAHSLNACCGLLAILPVLLLPVMLGGVTASAAWHMALVLVGTLFLSLAIGLFISAISENDRKAMFATVAVVGLATTWPVLLALLLEEVVQAQVHEDLLVPLFTFSPGFALWYALVLPSAAPWLLPPMRLYWWSLALVHLTGWCFLLGACFVLPRFVRDRPRRRGFARLSRALQRWGNGDARQQKEFRVRLLNVNPFLWLTVRNRVKLYHAWGLVGAMALGWGAGFLKHGDVMLDAEAILPMLFIFHGVLKVWVISEASHRLSEERNQGTFELLLSTPFGSREIIRGQWQALRQQFLWPVSVTLVLEAILLISVGRLQWFGNDQNVIGLAVASMTMLVIDLLTLGWVGMWAGLTARNYHRAILTSGFLVLVLPWTLYGVATYVGWFALEYLSRRGVHLLITLDFMGFEIHLADHPLLLQVLLWAAVCLAVNAVLVFAVARPRLLKRFREAAIERFGAKSTLQGTRN